MTILLQGSTMIVLGGNTLYVPPAPSPSITPTPTLTPVSPTPTSSPNLSPTPTVSPSITITPSHTPAVTPTVTPTVTPSPTNTGQTLLQYLAGGGASTYMLSGQTINWYHGSPYGTSPLTAIDTNATTSSRLLTTTVWNRAASPQINTGVLPAIINPIAIAGPQLATSSGPGFWEPVGTRTDSAYYQYGYGNASPMDWLTISQDAQAMGCIVDLVILISNPAGNGVNPWTVGSGSVITPGSPTYNTFIAYLNDLIPHLLTLTKPFIISPPGELNLGGAGYNIGQGWMSSGSTTSANVAQMFQIMFDTFTAGGVTNALWNFEIQAGSSFEPFSFGWNPNVFDMVSCDSTPVLFDSATYTYMQSLGIPMMYGSAIMVPYDANQSPTDNTYGTYNGTFPSGVTTHGGYGATGIVANQPDFSGAIWWGYDHQSPCEQGGATGIETSQVYGVGSPHGPWINNTSVPTFTKAGGKAGG